MAAPFRITREPAGTRRAGAAQGETDARPYLDRLMKMIPGEVIGLYLVGAGFIPPGQNIALVAWAVVCLIAVFVVRAYGTADPAKGLSPQWISVAISAVAFVIWLYSLGGPFAAYGLHVPFVGSLLVLAWTFFVPIFYKGTVDT
jgi:hypothetical protein